MPRVADHELEVVVRVNRRADVEVVLEELVAGHDAVALERVPLAQKLTEHLVTGHAPGNHLGMLGCVVRRRNVFNRHLAAAVLVKNVIRHQNKIAPALRHRAAEPAQELVVRDLAVATSIELADSHVELVAVHVDAKVDEPELELVGSQKPFAAVVDDAEEATNRADAIETAAAGACGPQLREHAPGSRVHVRRMDSQSTERRAEL
eukprot:Amastigsp_a508851_1298.p3 type:complete len:206 gc:universal Amastigsp_a508851_1298:904-287(-)